MKIYVFGTLGCHLCEQAEELIAAITHPALEFISIDIAEQEEWQADYALRIPVLYDPDSRKDLGWPFTENQIYTFIHEISND